MAEVSFYLKFGHSLDLPDKDPWQSRSINQMIVKPIQTKSGSFIQFFQLLAQYCQTKIKSRQKDKGRFKKIHTGFWSLSSIQYVVCYNIMDWIQLRSDTRTVPTKEMRETILTSSYGDWTYNEDDTVKELEEYTAKLFGKEDAAYVISGVFGNQVCILTATSPGDQVILREKGHIIKHENGSCGLISRAMTRALDCPQGYITPEQLRKVLRKQPDYQHPSSKLVVLQYPTFEGLIPPLEQFNECCLIAKERNMHVHVDGARVHNALAQVKTDPAEIFKNVDSLTFCLSKGLCSPMGSLVVGNKQFITRLKMNRKMLGGVVRKPGVVAGAGLLAMKTIRLQLGKDNQMARELSSRMKELGWIDIVVPVETNMIFYRITDPSIKAAQLEAFLNSKNIKAEVVQSSISRFVAHHYIREEQVDRVISALKAFKESLKSQTA